MLSIHGADGLHDTEHSPLLGRQHDSQASAIINKDERGEVLHSSNPFIVDSTNPRFRRVPVLACLIVFVFELDFFIKHIPMMRLIESLLCIDYYEAHDRSIIDQYGKNIPERLCKANGIQVEVGRMIGLMLFYLMIGAIIATVPLGHLADTRGRKWCLFNNALTWAFFGSSQLFIYLTYPLLPIWTLYFSGSFALIGGNFDIGVAILFSSVADVVPSNTQRTTLFFIISSMMYVAQAIFAPIGGWLLNLDGEGGTLWVPYVIGISSEIGLAALIAVAYPETLSKSPTPEHNSGRQSSSHESLKEQNILLKAKRQLSRVIYRKWKELEQSVQGIGVGSMLLLGLVMLFVTTGTKACDWYALVQYPIMKFGWKYSQSTLSLSMLAIVNVLNFGFITPYLTRLWSKSFSSTQNANLGTMAISTLLLIVGITTVGLSWNVAIFLGGLVVYSLGEGLSIAIQGYIISAVDSSKVARILSLMSAAKTAGKMIASAFYAKVLAWGVNTHIGVLIGLPCLVSAGLFAICGVLVIVHTLRVP
ncbi:MAG: hypothetical protein M1840_004167 [Geoglossum simile]|nr:MAG: hypothetical protein M1840_004167 [Geoglossum simile]